MTLVITLFNLRQAWSVIHWMQGWARAFCVAFPLIYLLAPIGQKLTARLTQP